MRPTTAIALASLCALAPAAQDAGAAGQERPANRLAGETSPYLRQHMHNPVDWYPWGEEALGRAREEDKPIFLSVGYSACHWCHVMERESFEDGEIAAFLNANYVCIKVDREERPDIDEIYMAAVQAMSGRGGWPMSVFLTPELEPFWGGTYFPPRPARGMPGFLDIARELSRLWKEERERVEEQGALLVSRLVELNAPEPDEHVPGKGVLDKARAQCELRYDPEHGGFAGAPRHAPKFPHCAEMRFLLRRAAREADAAAREMVEKTLVEMAQGGIYDQLAGGFARYSVDREWAVPHFEKMLYDNAQLAVVYTEAWQATGGPLYRRIAREVLDYLLREMTSPEGGFYSSTDADSEGEEGKFFAWSLDEVTEVCGADAAVAVDYYGVTRDGDFEGGNVLTARQDLGRLAERHGLSEKEARAAVGRARAKLHERREARVHPHLDDKVLAAWNGLALSAFARAAAVYGDERYLAAARRNAAFVLEKMRREDGGLWRTRRAGRSHLRATLEDYAHVTAGLFDLYEADLDPRWLRGAIELQGFVEEHFRDEGGGYYSFSDLHEDLPVRTRTPSESSLPNDIATAATNAYRIGLLAGDPERLDRPRATLIQHGRAIRGSPTWHGQMLLLVDLMLARPAEVYVVGPADHPAVRAELARLRGSWPPDPVFTRFDPGDEDFVKLLPAAEGKVLVDGRPAVYVCHEGLCEAPQALGE